MRVSAGKVARNLRLGQRDACQSNQSTEKVNEIAPVSHRESLHPLFQVLCADSAQTGIRSMGGVSRTDPDYRNNPSYDDYRHNRQSLASFGCGFSE